MVHLCLLLLGTILFLFQRMQNREGGWRRGGWRRVKEMERKAERWTQNRWTLAFFFLFFIIKFLSLFFELEASLLTNPFDGWPLPKTHFAIADETKEINNFFDEASKNQPILTASCAWIGQNTCSSVTPKDRSNVYM